MSYVVGLSNNSYKPITNTAWVRARLCKLQKGCTRLAAASDKVYQLFAHGRWFSPGTPASSTTKTGLHDIAEILLKVALKHQQSLKIIKSVTKLNGNSEYKITTYSSSLGTASTSNKLLGSTICFIKRIVSYFIHCIPYTIKTTSVSNNATTLLGYDVVAL